MDGNINLVTLIALIVALVVIFKLRSVLGRRTEEDDARMERYRAEQRKAAASARSGQDKVVTLPPREPAGAAPATTGVALAEAEARIRSMAGSNSEVERGLLDILRLDSQFDPEHFLRGAKQAYELIVTAFAEGNRKLLRDLLSREVYDIFSSSIADRESRGEQVDQSFVGISKADVVDAETKEGIASVTVRFVSQLITATRDKAGNVVGGDPQAIQEVTDIWTFSRDLSTARARANPNWKLVATKAAA